MSEPAILFGATDGFGAFTGFELVSDTPSTETDRARSLGSTGNEVAAQLRNTRTTYTSTYVCKSDTNTPPAKIGALVNGRVLESIEFSTSNSDSGNTMTLTGHQHADNAHADTLQQVAHGITGIKAFGAVDFLGGTAGAAASPTNGTCTIRCQHQDIQDKDGDHLVGENYDAMIEAETTWAGAPSANAAAGWDVTSVPQPVTNTNFRNTSVKGTKPLALASPT